LINNSEANREKIEKCILTVTLDAESSGLPTQKSPPGNPTPALQAIIQLILNKRLYLLRSSAAYTFQCFILDNFKGQLAMTESISNAHNTSGKMISDGLLDLSQSRKDLYLCIFSCKLFTGSIFENPAAKDTALSKEFEVHGEKVSLLNRICFSLMSGGNVDPKIQASFLVLLTAWMFDHPTSVKEFLSEGSNVQFVPTALILAC
jgi:Uso1 / p115 like vesicle tethering protein, head region